MNTTDRKENAALQPASTLERRKSRSVSPASRSAYDIDSHMMAQMARWSSGISPISLTLSWTDWALHLASSPGSQARLARRALESGMRWSQDAVQALMPHLNAATPAATPETPAATTPEAQAAATPDSLSEQIEEDSRYAAPEWQSWPWRPLASANKLGEQWWLDACNLRGMQDHSRHQMRFYGSQLFDLLSPSNFLPTNPQALQAAWQSRGQTLLQGVNLALDDLRRSQGMQPRHASQLDLAPGQGLAMTDGEVVLRNGLIELIQYRPSTTEVQAEPVLIIPSCIMKYYILDLSPHNSMVRWLVGQGHTVYIASWRNPDASDALLGMDDYVSEGVLAALDHVHGQCQAPVHLVGYCLGGTFAAMAAGALGGGDAVLSSQNPESAASPLASLSLLAAEVDFTDPGEMGVLIDEAQVRLLEDMMASKGFLTGQQMAASFQFLHARDLVWSSKTRRWLLGQEDLPNDLMVWNADVTRLPALMHSQYLRSCYLNNDLAEGHYLYLGRPISLRDIRVPVFAVGTLKDHVAPWRSVYKIHRLVSAEVTFALTSGGHNAGIVSEPGRPRRHYQLLSSPLHQTWRTPDEWLEQAPRHEGSWWPAWDEWFKAQGSGQRVPARAPVHDPALGSAPGQYVQVRYGD
ncbi:PHA/PHB synthase family protein [Serpentinimonas maccroryi]|uniref:PHA/PHB synthase family protein n=1 Tax=Serpentinimonas maccroryi TaxID=1458426 RepID=UPI0020331C9A|nr:alpha/beta fold hydrolase [Serpentinimonas maccroryi]MBA4253318.1 poly-beta-hydroxybutyrate polymerase [Comamonadaceae bacterium]MCM2479475.1 alpha/beta fold hydrolase [Serpentinimonas maccroryi]